MTEQMNSHPAQIFSDHWQAAEKDDAGEGQKLAFETAGLAKTLAQLAWNPDNATPFTVDVRGGWGRGKTTLLKEADRLLTENGGRAAGSRHVKTLWVNVWKYPSEDTVLAGLLGALLEKFKTDDWKTQLTGLINAHKGTLAISVLRMAAPWLPTKFEEIFKADPVQGLSDAITRKRAFHDEFEPLFCHLAHLYLFETDAIKPTTDKSCRALWEENSREAVLAIFLDDLDRCNEDRVMQVLEAINLFLDMPGVCFYLGIDFERLSEILKRKLDNNEDRAAAFMEKIIQISLPLPHVSSEGARDYLESLIKRNSSLKEVINDDVKTIGAILENRNPRHIKRFLNDLSMRLSILENTGKLGEESPKIPSKAVLAWHIFHEAMPLEAENAAKLQGNLDSFLRKWESNRKIYADSEKRTNIEKDQLRHHEKGFLAGYLQIIHELSDEQKKTLLHLASPDVETIRVAKRSSRSSPKGTEWVEIEPGTFMMGSDLHDDEKPVQPVAIDKSFKIAKYPVTNIQYKNYLEAVGSEDFPKHWENGEIPDGKEKHPVVFVSWVDAMQYCEWLTSSLGGNDTVRLPTEAEWEYVAAGAGEKPRKYPWGDKEPDKDRANYENNEGNTTEVDGYPEGATPKGVFDMAGNVFEWTLSEYKKYPYQDGDGRNGIKGVKPRVVRGGCFYLNSNNLRSASRFWFQPIDRDDLIGFRVVLSSFSYSEN
ncbi:SUMF1/EgtB/PvdO family nonheme iron enzyme [Desulfosediminicola flagellatus]|uniref:SUMF1/EgtB/PvdO family nonheme iron enzyme n=1 Tax=Desulfosediminicola flagellatus TaxID=2569541 RepID=UPI00142EAB06|nr:SUMF1/EgtB/PvdO family nonheme iron enzyme [Desulfosediminicola flagellatus]